jgi:membrane-bound lytic murein transglycosylase D
LQTRVLACYSAAVKKVLGIALLLVAVRALAQDEVAIDDVMQSAQEWASNNLDDATLHALQDNVDREKVRQFLATLQKDFRGEHVVDLAQLRDTAKFVLPLLKSSDDTRPYAIWLKTRLDYFDAANELRFVITPPKTQPNKLPAIIPDPKPSQVREIWIKKITQEGSPKESNPLASELKPIFVEEKIPPELVWIAEVESSFDSRARSPAGAAGLFQLMPATAKRFGLRTWPFDQRFQSEPSARAAAKYLRTLNAQFKNWRLALAAYNAGEGTVQKFLNRNKTKTYDSIAAYLPAETQMYVPKVEAVLFRREGVKLDDLPSAMESR